MATFAQLLSQYSQSAVSFAKHLSENAAYVADTGTADALVVTLSTAPAVYSTSMLLIVKKSASANTGASTINVSALGIKSIVKDVDTTLESGDMPANGLCFLQYDGTNFLLLNPAKSAALSTHMADYMTLLINAKYPPTPLVGASASVGVDDTAVLQAIIDYAAANNKQVFVPPGTYEFTTLVIPQDFKLFGIAGEYKGTVFNHTGTGVGFDLSGSFKKTVLEGFTIIGGGAASVGINIMRPETQIRNVEFRSYLGTAFLLDDDPLSTSGAWMSTLEHVKINGATVGIDCVNNVNEVTIKDFQIHNCTTAGIRSSGSNSSLHIIDGNLSENDNGTNTSHAIDISGGVDISIKNCYIENNDQGIYVSSVDNLTIQDCFINGVNVQGNGIYLTSANVKQVNILNCHLIQHFTADINLNTSPANVFIINCHYTTLTNSSNSTVLEVTGSTIVGRGLGVITNGLVRKSQNKTADYTVTYEDSETTMTNIGAGANVAFTLPATRPGVKFTFIKRQLYQAITLVPVAGDKFVYRGSVKTDGQTFVASESGHYASITIEGIDEGWYVHVNDGTWA